MENTGDFGKSRRNGHLFGCRKEGNAGKKESIFTQGEKGIGASAKPTVSSIKAAGCPALPESDLACERRRADLTARGVERKVERRGGATWERIRITSEEGAKSIGRPQGQYDTLTLERMDKLDEEERDDAANEIAKELCALFDLKGIIPDRLLVVGLGNEALTPDAIGPKSAKNVNATLHIRRFSPEMFEEWECSEIAVSCPGVMAESGMEAGDTVRGIVERLSPDCVIAIDALAARAKERLGTTVQISDTGIFPGSGIGNGRSPLDERTLGVPVIAIGVPTVIDARVFLGDALHAERMQEGDAMFVSPREIDGITSASAEIISRGINRAFGIL